MRSFEAAVAAAPAAEAGLYAAGGILLFVAWAALIGLQHGWGATFGPALQWIADKIDAVHIPIPHHRDPRPLGALAHAFRSLDKNISHALGAAALNCEHAATYLFSHAAAQIRQVGRWIEEVGLDIGVFVHRIEHRVIPRAIRWAVHIAEHAGRAAIRPWVSQTARLYRTALRAAHIARTAATHAERSAAHALDWSERAFGRAERAARGQARRLTRLEKITAGAAFAAIVATALNRLGLRWLRCSNTRKAGKQLCGMDVNLLESLLLDSVAIVGAISIVEFAKELQAVEGEAVKLIRGFIREA